VIGLAMQRFKATLPTSGSALEQLQGHLDALKQLMQDDLHLWAVMGELVLRAPRDMDLSLVLQQTDDFWHRTLMSLLERCIAEGALDAQLDADETATLVMAALKGLSLPTMVGFQPEVADKVFRQLERVLGLRLATARGRAGPDGARDPTRRDGPDARPRPARRGRPAGSARSAASELRDKQHATEREE
jgi:BetI-type transcriptional repressor, C-terminal